MKLLLIFMIGLFVVTSFSGCLGDKKTTDTDSTSSQTTNVLTDVNAQIPEITDESIPFIEENDTVEIGEMI